MINNKTETTRNPLRVIDLFAGVGGFRVGLERANKVLRKDVFKVVWGNQWEPGIKTQHAAEIYKKQFKTSDDEFSNEDINTVATKDIPDHDVIVAGFPCQDYSVATTKKLSGGIEGRKGVLWWQLERILREKGSKSAKYFIFENVDRLLSSPAKQRGRDFAIMLTCLNNLGYMVEWRVIDASQYGFPQRRKRTFFIGYKKGTKPYKQFTGKKKDAVEWLSSQGLFAKGFPIEPLVEGNVAIVENIPNKKRSKEEQALDVKNISDSFNKEGKTSPFMHSGVMKNGKVYTTKVKSSYKGKYTVLRDILVNETDVPEEYLIPNEQLKKWQYLKGAKKEERVSASTGHKYYYSEGAITYPDALDRASRTIITGEGGAGPSRFKHVVKTPSGRLRRLMPIELERLDMFDDEHTLLPGVSDSRRAFMMGNALVVGVVQRIGEYLSQQIMSSNNKIYNQRSAEGILQKALELRDKSIEDLYPDAGINYRGKGKLGQLVEKLHFGYEPNSNQVADFYDAGVELKTSPIKQLSNGSYVSKERLSLTHIDFNKLVEESNFEDSTLLKKIDVLLLMFYLYQQGLTDIEYIFKIIKLWKIPEKDFHIIKQDWNKIVTTVRGGNAHLISGGDTYYLEASTTGQGKGRDLVNQPCSDIKAKKRRFAFKSKYVNLMIADELKEMESLLPEDFDFEKSSIEKYIISQFSEYYGYSESKLKERFKLQYNKSSKHSANLIARAILGLTLDNKVPIEEFEKANMKIKTIVLNENGVLKESMSFQQINYEEVTGEKDFTKSFLYKEIVSAKYLFVIFRKDAAKEKYLEKVVLWNMDAEAESIAQEFWLDIKTKIQDGDFDNFWKSSDKKIFHVRPKARNAKDLKQLSDGSMVKKYAYWLNRNYILEKIISNNL